MSFSFSHRRSGFTLIELLIVVAIIAILAAIAVPNFLEAQVRAKVSRVRADVRSVATAMETYRIDTNRYPLMSDFPNPDMTGPWPAYHPTYFHSRIPSYITTPVSYISSLPVDIFLPNGSAQSPLNRYVYFNYDGMVKSGAVSATTKAQNEQTGGYLFYSLGPDGTTNQAGAAYKTGPNGTWTRYEPTNGTTSWGNIIRTAKSPEGQIGAHPGNTSSTTGPN